jgi:quercetin dioxygenase-like cupin family protein
MTMSGYAVARIDEIEELHDGREPMRPVRHHFGITAFGVTAWTAKSKGDRIINEHDEDQDGAEELYVVTQGHARFEVGGESVDAPAGSLVHVEPNVTRTAFAEQDGTTILVVGGTPGQPYHPVGWEIWAPLRPRYEAGENEAVRDELRPLVEANPQYPLLAYNLACLEALTGQKDEALVHLRQAAETSQNFDFREFARNDSDLDSIRDEPAFAEIVG